MYNLQQKQQQKSIMIEHVSMLKSATTTVVDNRNKNGDSEIDENSNFNNKNHKKEKEAIAVISTSSDDSTNASVTTTTKTNTIPLSQLNDKQSQQQQLLKNKDQYTSSTTNNNNNNTNKRRKRIKDNNTVTINDFTSLSVGGHPYGLLPYGNRMLCSNSSTTSTSNSSSMILSDKYVQNNDECWYSITQYLNAYDLLQFRSTCQFAYIICHQSELWRDLLLHQLVVSSNSILTESNSNSQSQSTTTNTITNNIDCTNNNNNINNNNNVITEFSSSWFDTYFLLFGNNNNKNTVNNKNKRKIYHTPIQVSNIFSDYYYRLHTCRAFTIPYQWLVPDSTSDDNNTYDFSTSNPTNTDTNNSVDRINVTDMTITKFITHYEQTNTPVVIVNGASSWKATQYWSNNNYLQKQEQQQQKQKHKLNSVLNENNATNDKSTTPTTTVTTTKTKVYRATSGVAPLPANFTLQSYIQYATNNNNNNNCDNTDNHNHDDMYQCTDKKSKTETTTNYSTIKTETTTSTTTDDEETIQVQKSSLFEEGPLYLFDRNALECYSPLWYDYYPDLQRTCPYWDPERFLQYESTVSTCTSTEQKLDEQQNQQQQIINSSQSDSINVGHDLFQLLGTNERPDHTWMIIGPKRSGSVFHIDPNATHAWNACIVGIKRWIFYPPSTSNPPPGVYPSTNGDDVTIPLSIGEWIYQYWSEHTKRKNDTDINLRPIEVTTYPGDIIFVPHGWWHMVINISSGLNIAITHNYVSYSNLSNVLRFLRTKQEQISGCRDRVDSIKPNKLYTQFYTKIQQYVPKQLLQSIVVSSNTDWTCSAWNNNTNTNRCNESTTNTNGGGNNSRNRNGNVNNKKNIQLTKRLILKKKNRMNKKMKKQQKQQKQQQQQQVECLDNDDNCTTTATSIIQEAKFNIGNSFGNDSTTTQPVLSSTTTQPVLSSSTSSFSFSFM